MTKLREVKRRAIARIEIRSSVVWWKENERVQKREYPSLVVSRKRPKCITSYLGLAAVPKDDLCQIDAAAIVTIRRGRTYTPKRRGQKLCSQGTVVIALVEGRSQIVPLEIREDVSDEK